MALTFTETYSGVEGSLYKWYGSITFDSSYPTGGESITADDFGLTEIYHLDLTTDQGDSAAEFWGIAWDKSASKLQAFGGAGATTTALDEVASTDDLSGFVVYCCATGPSAAV